MNPFAMLPSSSSARSRCIFALAIAFQVAYTVRFLFPKCFWLDECWQFFVVAGSLDDMRAVLRADTQAPAYYYLLWAWFRIAPFSETWLRSLSLVFSLLAYFPLHAFVRRVLNVTVADIACALLALMPFHLHFGAEARPYSMVEFLVLLSSWLFVRTLDAEDSPREWWANASAYAASAVLLFWTNPLALFSLVAHAVFLLFRWRRTPWRRWIPVAFAMFALCLPCVLQMWNQPRDIRLAWVASRYPFGVQPGTVLDTLLAFGASGFNDRRAPWYIVGFMAILAPLLAAGIGAAWRLRASDNAAEAHRPLLVLMLLFFPGTLLVLASLKQPLYLPRYVIGAMPFFAAMLAFGLARIPGRARRAAAFACVAAFLFVSTLAARHHSLRSDWRGFAKALDRAVPADAARDVLVLACDNAILIPARFYLHHSARPRPDLVLARTDPGAAALADPAQAPKVVVLLHDGYHSEVSFACRSVDWSAYRSVGTRWFALSVSAEVFVRRDAGADALAIPRAFIGPTAS